MIIRICATRSRGETDFIASTIRFTAPTSIMNVIWKMLAATIRLIGNDATTPASDARNATAGAVWNARTATASVTTQPTSAGDVGRRAPQDQQQEDDQDGQNGEENHRGLRGAGVRRE